MQEKPALHRTSEFFYICARQIRDVPAKGTGITAIWQEEQGKALKRIIFCARHSDLVVVGLLLRKLMKYLVSIECNCARETHSARNPQGSQVAVRPLLK